VPDIARLETAQAKPGAIGEATIKEDESSESSNGSRASAFTIITDDQDNEPYMADIRSGPVKHDADHAFSALSILREGDEKTRMMQQTNTEDWMEQDNEIISEPEWDGSLLQEEATALDEFIDMENDKTKQGDETTRMRQEDRMEQDNESKQKGGNTVTMDPVCGCAYCRPCAQCTEGSLNGLCTTCKEKHTLDCTNKSMVELFEDHESADEMETTVELQRMDQYQHQMETTQQHRTARPGATPVGAPDTAEDAGEDLAKVRWRQDNELGGRDGGCTWREPRQPERPPNASPSTNAFQFFNRRRSQQHNRFGFYWGFPQDSATGDFHWSPNEHPANAGVAAEELPDHQESGSRHHEATTADDARGQAAELDTLWRQASHAPTSTDSSVSDSSPVDDTTSTDSAVCMQCEFNPGTEGPLGQFCRKCAVELSEAGIQIYRRV